MRMINLSKIIFLFAFVSIQCKNTPQKSSAELDKSLFYLKTTECMGECPVFTFTVFADGACTYEGNANVEKIGSFAGKLSPEQLNGLKTQLVSSDFFNLNVKNNTLVKDLPSTYLYYNNGEQNKTILYYNAHDKTIDKTIEISNALISGIEWSKK